MEATKPILFISGMPGAGKTYLAKFLSEHEFPRRQLRAEYIEMSAVVKQWIADVPSAGANIMETETGSTELRSRLWKRVQLCDQTPGVDLVIVSGVREVSLLHSDVVDRRHMIVYLDVSAETRRQRYERSGRWDFKQVDRRASELGTPAVARHAVCMLSDSYQIAAASTLIANLAQIYLFTKETHRAASVH